MDLRSQLQASLGAAFNIERELGGGGMSRVFVANEVRLSRKVVIKVLNPELVQGLNAATFRAGDPARGLAAAGQHRPGARGRRRRRAAVLHDAVRGGGVAAQPAGRQRAAHQRCPRDPPGRGQGAGIRPRPGHRPSRHQARQRAALRRHGGGHRLRHRQGAERFAHLRRRRHPDPDGHGDRHPGLHGAGTGRRRPEPRSSGRSLRPRLHGAGTPHRHGLPSPTGRRRRCSRPT